MTALTHQERRSRIDGVRNMTPSQATYITGLVEARYAEDAPERVALREQFAAIRSSADVTAMIDQLKVIPTLQDRRRYEVEAMMPTEDGYYRNPETGELYRLRRPPKASWDLIVSKYSKTGGPRRLTVEGNLVKGKWKTLTSFHSRMMLARGEISKDWLLTQDEMTEFAFGLCPYHGGPLSDGVSVALGYGKICASRQGLPWSEDAAREAVGSERFDALLKLITETTEETS